MSRMRSGVGLLAAPISCSLSPRSMRKKTLVILVAG